VSRRDHHTLDEDAKLFMALNNALLDASITAWDAKQQWNSVRPITAVRWLKKGQLVQAWGGPYQGTRTIRGEDWLPSQGANFVTPSFPEYNSGHSTFSAAAAAVLKAFAGDTFGMSVTIPAGSSRVEPRTETQPGVPAAPVTLSWKSFSAAADQAGISREYGGIHFNDGDFEARQAASWSANVSGPKPRATSTARPSPRPSPPHHGDDPAMTPVNLRRADAADAGAVAEVRLRARRAAVPAILAPVHPDDEVRQHFQRVVVPTTET
jgi:hypothetical protein